MQVILKEKIRNLGQLGDSVNVKPGFARNFLIPQGKALRANKENLAHFEAQRAELERLEGERLKSAQECAAKLAEIKLELSAKAGEGGKLFGSIGTRDIAEYISSNGVELAKHQVRMPEGVIRQVGEYQVTVHLHSDVDVTLDLSVIPA